MTLKPDNGWQWKYDSQYDRIKLDLTDGELFYSRYASKMLIPDAFDDHPFCVNDATLYAELMENCRGLPLEDEQRRNLVLNSLIAHRFLKPQMPKSWFFVVNNSRSDWQPGVGHLVTAELTHNAQDAMLLVVESNAQASLCVVAQADVKLNTGRVMALGDAIKIMNDRLTPCPAINNLQFSQVG